MNGPLPMGEGGSRPQAGGRVRVTPNGHLALALTPRRLRRLAPLPAGEGEKDR